MWHSSEGKWWHSKIYFLLTLVGDDQKWYSSEGGIVSKFDCTEFHEHSWMHNFPKRLGTMPQSQISHELVSHQKCHNAQNAQMGRKFS